MSKTLSADEKDIIDGKHFATVVTLNPDGSPQSSLGWITRDGDDLLLSITTTRQKYRNLSADPRTTVLVPRDDPQQGYVEVRGQARLTEEGGRDLINRLYNKYIDAGDYPWDPEGTVRVIARVTPEHVVSVKQY